MTAEMVRLRNKAEAPLSAVRTSMDVLRILREMDPIAFFELAELARDPGHQPWGNTGARLQASGLLDADGHLHGITRDVVLSATVSEGAGENLNYLLVSPFAAEATSG